MSNPRTDYLATACDLGGLSIQDFQEAFCVRCVQTECTRSLHGKSRFEDRVQNWHQRLFSQVPRMAEGDPRFLPIAGQRFMSIEAPAPGATSAWVDPRDLGKSPSIVVPQSLLTPPAAPPAVKAPETPTVTTERPQRRFLPLNTPNQGGIMIGGAPSPSEAPAKDPWASPVPGPKSTETVIAPGTKIKLGGSGV